MNITVIGASAGLGLATVMRALERKHRVTALSRSDIPLPDSQQLQKQIGNATKKEDLLLALENTDAVIVTLGTRKDMKATHLFSTFANLLVEVQNETNTRIPHILVTGFGAGKSKNYVGWFVRLFLKYVLNDVYADKSQMEETIENSDLNWIIVRPGRLMDRPLTEKYRIENTLYKGINIGEINRSDVADFLVKQAENPTELNRFVAISQK